MPEILQTLFADTVYIRVKRFVNKVGRAGGRTPRIPRPGWGAHVAQGPYVTYENFFLVF